MVFPSSYIERLSAFSLETLHMQVFFIVFGTVYAFIGYGDQTMFANAPEYENENVLGASSISAQNLITEDEPGLGFQLPSGPGSLFNSPANNSAQNGFFSNSLLDISGSFGIIVAGLFALFFLNVIKIWKFKTTISKRLVGSVIVHESNRNLTLVEAFIREFVKIFSCLLLVGALWMLIDRRRQALHDKIVKSLVLREVVPNY